MKKIFISAFLVFSLAIALFTVSAQDSFIGNKRSHKYHYSTCVMVGRMSPKNKIRFNTYQEALEKGYIGCKVCKSPMGLK